MDEEIIVGHVMWNRYLKPTRPYSSPNVEKLEALALSARPTCSLSCSVVRV